MARWILFESISIFIYHIFDSFRVFMKFQDIFSLMPIQFPWMIMHFLSKSYFVWECICFFLSLGFHFNDKWNHFIILWDFTTKFTTNKIFWKIRFYQINFLISLMLIFHYSEFLKSILKQSTIMIHFKNEVYWYDLRYGWIIMKELWVYYSINFFFYVRVRKRKDRLSWVRKNRV